MATQETLSWNGVTICDNTAGKSWYNVLEKHKMGDFFEFAFPNSTGRSKRIIGSENKQGTSRTISVSGTTRESLATPLLSISALREVSTKIGTALASASPHGTLRYGQMDVAGEITEANMDCDFNVTRFWRNAADPPEYFMDWTAVFTKWGE